MCDECMVGCRSEMPFGDHEFKNYDLICLVSLWPLEKSSNYQLFPQIYTLEAYDLQRFIKKRTK
jgi:hypothetical protein